MHHSPSGAEAEIKQLLMQRFAALDVEVWCVACRRRHRADNIIAKIPGENPDRAIAITAQKYEIGAIVKSFDDQGRVKVIDIPVQLTILSQFGSDASIAKKFGHVGRATCLAFPTQNTHGYEIAHLGAIANCINLLKAFWETEFES
ncbi:MAG: hypothetical protein ACYTXI_08100 [Nostoc sp.]